MRARSALILSNPNLLHTSHFRSECPSTRRIGTSSPLDCSFVCLNAIVAAVRTRVTYAPMRLAWRLDKSNRALLVACGPLPVRVGGLRARAEFPPDDERTLSLALFLSLRRPFEHCAQSFSLLLVRKELSLSLLPFRFASFRRLLQTTCSMMSDECDKVIGFLRVGSALQSRKKATKKH